MVAKCNDVACTSTPTITRVDSAGDVGSYSSIATTSLAIARRPVISYYDATGGDLKLVLCGNEACSSGNSILRIISFGNHGKYTSIAIGVYGNPIISYYDDTNDDLLVMHCTNQSCSNREITLVESSGQTGQYTSIGIGKDGLPVIAYRRITSGALKLAHCSNVGCTASTPGLWWTTHLMSAGILTWPSGGRPSCDQLQGQRQFRLEGGALH